MRTAAVIIASRRPDHHPVHVRSDYSQGSSQPQRVRRDVAPAGLQALHLIEAIGKPKSQITEAGAQRSVPERLDLVIESNRAPTYGRWRSARANLTHRSPH